MRLRGEVDAECKRLIEQVRRRCPDAFDPDPLKPSTPGPELPLKAEELAQVVRVAAGDGSGRPQLWQRDGDELLVDVRELSLDLHDGLVLVHVPVECDQTGPARVQVAFAVGSRKRPAGMLAAADSVPRGPHAVTEGWADELTALAWRALTEAVTGLAADAGRDTDGTGLVPVGIEAARGVLTVRTIARHEFDRVGR